MHSGLRVAIAQRSQLAEAFADGPDVLISVRVTRGSSANRQRSRGDQATFLLLELLVSFYFPHLGVVPACKSVYHVCAWCLRRPEESTRFPGTVVMDAHESQDPGSPRIEPGSCGRATSVLATEPSLQPHSFPRGSLGFRLELIN